MFLKRHPKHAGGEEYEYWTLVRTVRTARGPRHQTVAHLGKLDEHEQRANGWKDLEAMLDGRSVATQPPLPWADGKGEGIETPLWRRVNVRGVRVERVRQFGRVYLGLALWRRLGLHEVLRALLPPGQEEIGWDLIGAVLTLGRFCAQQSELELAERWYEDTALDDLLGIPVEKINEARLYRGLDQLLDHKEALCAHLLQRYRDWFGVRFEFLLYDVTSTYFEGLAEKNALAARGYSRDSRPDCKQVCIGLVVTPEGLPVAYEVFAGNRNDVTTLEDIVEMMEQKYGQAQRVWVFDRGISSEENLEWLRQRGATYLVGTPKSQLKRYQAQLLDQADWHAVREGLDVKLVCSPEGPERFILCRSTDRAAKESAMLQRQVDRLRAQFEKLDRRLRQHPTAAVGPLERRLGRWLGRYPAAGAVFAVELHYDAEQKACGLKVQERAERMEWARLAHGAYLLRTNHPETDPVALWRWYIQLTQAEAAFRSAKSDLNLRPVFHQKAHRVQAHVLVCFLALALWRTLEQWMHAKGLGDCARQLLKELDELRSMDVILPTQETSDLRLRVVARPEKPLAFLLARLGLSLPNLPKPIENVVQKNTIAAS
jgi:transposase